MSVFKKLVSFLFEEEEEIYEEGELENISLKEEKKREPEVIRTQSVPPVKKHVEERVVEQPKKVVEQQPAVQLPPETQNHFKNIEITKQEPTKNVQRVQRAAPQRAPSRSVEVNKPEFEFVPVISPIFGADEHTKKAPAKSVSVPQNRTTQPTIVKKNPLGTIISPIYGATELAEFEMEARERIENMELRAAQPVAFDNDEIDDEDDDAISVPLEDLLASDERDEEDEDLLQFSLFGDDEVVSTELMKDSYIIKE